RTIGLGEKLVRDTLELASTEYVEMSAVMAKYNPFAEKAGMKRILEQRPPKEAENIVRVLEGLGFDTQLLGSRTYVVSRLQTLTEKDVLRIREAFAKYRHTRFMKSFSYHLPFGTRDAYVKEVMAADLDKLAGLMRICGFLMQTKAYLFWEGE
ncbi:hypothetical protein MUO69_02470, partial [Candidatus Bathyarchaeota archaeon]|nr:hypothetical protein [Candidatus Bathyarchaeota archaeon]